MLTKFSPVESDQDSAGQLLSQLGKSRTLTQMFGRQSAKDLYQLAQQSARNGASCLANAASSPLPSEHSVQLGFTICTHSLLGPESLNSAAKLLLHSLPRSGMKSTIRQVLSVARLPLSA